MKKFFIVLWTALTLSMTASAFESGDWVLETTGDFSVQRIRFIDGHDNVQLENGRWYKTNELSKIVKSYRNLKVGQMVVERVGDTSVQRIQKISASGWFQLKNKKWYRYSQLDTVR